MTGVMIERDSHAQQFVVLHNRVVRDKRLSRSARGLLAELLSLPPRTRVTIETLAENGPEGRHAIGRMLTELEKAGYVERPPRERNERGQWVHRIIVRETPKAPEADSPTPENQARCDQPSSASPQVTPSAGFPAPENLPIRTKDEDQKTIKDGPARVTPDAPADPAASPEMTSMITKEVKIKTGRTITAADAVKIARHYLARSATTPANPIGFVRACLRNEPIPANLLPTPAPPRFTAPKSRPVVTDRAAKSIAEAKAALARLKQREPVREPERQAA